MEIGNVLTLIGSLTVFLLGLFLILLQGLRKDIISLSDKIDARVLRPEYVREMDKIKDDFREIERDVKEIIKGVSR